jgi:hypothetical protein
MMILLMEIYRSRVIKVRYEKNRNRQGGGIAIYTKHHIYRCEKLISILKSHASRSGIFKSRIGWMFTSSFCQKEASDCGGLFNTPIIALGI